MGLDMYLYERRYVGYNADATVKSKDFSGNTEHIHTIKNVSYVIAEIGYWRKANHIHNWFVNNVQNGVDNCNEYIVSKSKLLELKDICQKVLQDKSLSEELLPTCKGFFFGSFEYDEYYYKDIENTIKIIDTALERIEKFDSNIYYQSSW